MSARTFFVTKTHCIRGHEFTPQNTRRSDTGKQCRTCDAIRLARHRPAKKIRKPATHRKLGHEYTPNLKERRTGITVATKERRIEIAKMGGVAISRNKEHMANIGRSGGKVAAAKPGYMSELGRRSVEARKRKKLALGEDPSGNA